MNFLLPLLGFTFIIFIHELGHFLAARWAKVRVEVFSIGIGPRLLTLFRDKKGTEYILSMLPFGGYVKLFGQEDVPKKYDLVEDNESFQTKPPLKRLVIMVGGVAMNLFLTYVFIVTAYTIGIRFTTNQIGIVEPNSPAEKAGVQTKDFITAINGTPTETFEDIFVQGALSDKEKPLQLELLRDGEKKTLSLSWGNVDEKGIKLLGVGPYPQAIVGELDTKSEYYQKGFREGMRIVDMALSTPDHHKNKTQHLETSLKNAQSGWHLLTFIEKNPKSLVDVSVHHHGTSKVIKSVNIAVKRVKEKEFKFTFIPRVKVMKGYPADLAGMKNGDVITAINGKKIKGFEDIPEYLRSLKKSRPLLVSLLRDGKIKNIFVKPKNSHLNKDLILGVYPFTDKNPAREISWINPAVQSQLPDLKVGDKMVNYKRTADKNVVVRIKRDEKEVEFTYSLKPLPTVERGALFPIALSEKKIKLPLHEAIIKSFRLTYRELQEVYLFIYQMINGNISTSNIGGPIAIFETSSTVYDSHGFSYFLLLLAKISISLAVTNLLPIPVLDGGHVMFILYEMIFKKPAPAKLIYIMHVIGFTLLLFLFIYININDIQRLLSR